MLCATSASRSKRYSTSSCCSQRSSAAAWGVDRAPVVAPSWYDMAPGSPFLEALRQQPLPRHVQHALFFSYGGSSSLRSPANDGVVTVASQLELTIQLQASRVIGFDATHPSVLQSEAVAAELQRTLDGLAPP